MADGLELTFDLPAAPDAVFAAWTDRDRIMAWWEHTGEYRTADWRADVRVGGAWAIEFVDLSGGKSGADGRYVEVERPGRLVWTWRASWDPDAETTIDMTFTAVRGATVMTLRQTGFASADERDDGIEAWNQVVGWLAEWLAGGETIQPA